MNSSDSSRPSFQPTWPDISKPDTRGGRGGPLEREKRGLRRRLSELRRGMRARRASA